MMLQRLRRRREPFGQQQSPPFRLLERARQLGRACAFPEERRDDHAEVRVDRDQAPVEGSVEERRSDTGRCAGRPGVRRSRTRG